MAGESDLRWTSPKTQSQIQRSKHLRDAITQMGQQSKDVFNTAEGTNYNILANAILGYKANQAENRAHRMVKSDNDRLTSAILGTPQTAAAEGLTQDKPFDLTPGGFEGRAQDVDTNRLKAISEMGGPMAALQYQQGQAAQKKADDRYTDETQYSRGRDTRGDFVQDRAFDYGKERDANQDDQWRMGFEQSGEQFGAKMAQDADQFGKTFGETVRHNQASEGAKLAGAGVPDFGDENALRNQYLGQAKTFQDVARSAASVRSLSPDLNPAEQMGLIFQTMKMLDPGSTVREGEYANAQNTTSAYGQLWNAYNKASTGEGLNPTQIAQFRGMINGLYNAAEGQYAETYDFYRNQAPRYGMDPSIIQDFRLPPDQNALTPEAVNNFANSTPPALSWATKGFRPQGAQPAAQPRPEDLSDEELERIAMGQ